MADIVERLRGLADLFEAGDAPRHVVLHMRAGADEIERLRAALELFACDCIESGNLCPSPHACRNYVARAALEGEVMTDEIEHDKPDAITRLRAENERLGRDYQTARNAHDKLVLKNERLRAALEVFACDCEGKAICLGNCMHRNARAALEGK